MCRSSGGGSAPDAGVFGDFLCDSPYRLIQSALRHTASLIEPHDFIIWTGDSPPHVAVELLSTDEVIDVIRNLTETIRLTFPRLPVYPALGNHDYWPQDQLPASPNAVYQAAAELWSPWLQPEALETLKTGGFYSQQVAPGLRVVSLNTVLYYPPDQAASSQSDPGGQFLWLEETLQEAAQSLEKVYVIAHVPVGYLPFARNTTALLPAHNERLLSIFRRHAHVIAGQFYGHTHRDSVMVLLDHRGEPVSSVFVSPAVTPFKHAEEPYSNNPAVRMYLYSREDYGVLDIWQYFLNLTEANLSQRADWRLEYVMTSSFGMGDLRPPSLLRLALSLRLRPSGAFRVYFLHHTVSYADASLCDADCFLSQVCSVCCPDRHSYSRCVGQGEELAGTGLNQPGPAKTWIGPMETSVDRRTPANI